MNEPYRWVGKATCPLCRTTWTDYSRPEIPREEADEILERHEPNCRGDIIQQAVQGSRKKVKP